MAEMWGVALAEIKMCSGEMRQCSLGRGVDKFM